MVCMYGRSSSTQPRHGIPARILKLVDRRADRDDQSVGRGDVRPGRRSEELSRGERLLQLRFTSLLDEWKSPRHEGPDAVGVEVVDQRSKAAVWRRQRRVARRRARRRR